MKNDVVDIIQGFFTLASFRNGLNKTNPILIPKKKECKSPLDFWPIALSNVLYKTVAKILPYRLRPLLDSYISPNQVAFIPGRQIVVKFIVAKELIQSMKKKKKLKVLCVGPKAYHSSFDDDQLM